MVRRLANLILRWGLAGILGVTSLFGSSLHDILGIPSRAAGRVRLRKT